VHPESSSPQSPDIPELISYPGGEVMTDRLVDTPLHLAIGMFDGVHLGHQAVMRKAIEAASSEPGSISGVFTFDPHPSRVLRPEQATPLLMPLDQRIRRMLAMGIDQVFVQPFTRLYAAREAEAFAPSLRAYFPLLKSLHVGENFRFGSRRSGDVDTLYRSAAELGIEVDILKRESLNGEPISSSAIREALRSGDMSAANTMLGYAYTIEGTIIPGKKVGRGLGFPTVNIPWNPEAVPRFGVYAVSVTTDSLPGKRLRGIANYGLRPTVDQSEAPLLEVHFLDRPPFPTTGDPVQVSLLEFIRPERKFTSTEALQKQIREDVDAIRGRPFPDVPAGV
jgi:riboflavin kinase/FMN adenylyltransferase